MNNLSVYLRPFFCMLTKRRKAKCQKKTWEIKKNTPMILQRDDTTERR
uniref:Uncharacterized protein n=1 Tax=Rhizophora mucronata TaxID=61149 RepID=A0A2P2QZD3_RHIMU